MNHPVPVDHGGPERRDPLHYAGPETTPSPWLSLWVFGSVVAAFVLVYLLRWEIIEFFVMRGWMEAP